MAYKQIRHVLCDVLSPNAIWDLHNQVDGIRFTYSDIKKLVGVQGDGRAICVCPGVETTLGTVAYHTKCVFSDKITPEILMPYVWKLHQDSEAVSEVDEDAVECMTLEDLGGHLIPVCLDYICVFVFTDV